MKIKYIHTEDPRGAEFNKLISEYFPEMLSEETPELILVCGGDGAMLHAIQDYGELKLPFLGKAAGTLNFLMNEFDNDQEVLTKIIDGTYELELQSSSAIKVELISSSETKFIGEAINEVALGSSIMGYHEFLVNAENSAFNDFDFKGSGIAVSAPLGTTGFNFNNRGAVLPLNSELWSVTGIVTNKRINDILESQEMQLEVLGVRNEGVKIFIDGITQPYDLQPKDIVRLTPGRKIEIAFIDAKKFKKHRYFIASRHRR